CGGAMRLRADQLQGFYEDCYTPGVDGDKYRRWRELGAVTKADHVVDLAARIGVIGTASVAEIGCGDGAVLAELGRRGFGQRRMVTDAGWRVRGEITDPLPREVHLFDKTTPAAKAKGYAKWAIRVGVGAVPGGAERLFTVHYALVATR